MKLRVSSVRGWRGLCGWGLVPLDKFFFSSFLYIYISDVCYYEYIIFTLVRETQTDSFVVLHIFVVDSCVLFGQKRKNE